MTNQKSITLDELAERFLSPTVNKAISEVEITENNNKTFLAPNQESITAQELSSRFLSPKVDETFSEFEMEEVNGKISIGSLRVGEFMLEKLAIHFSLKKLSFTLVAIGVIILLLLHYG